MKIGIGIMAYNEERNIRAALESLSQQDLFALPANRGASIEISIVANGCKDRTAEVAGRACEEFFAGRQGIVARADVIEKAGKSNAWNEYVHRLADQAADFLILMDGDIKLVGNSTLRLMLEKLEASPEANVAVDVILKDIAFKENKTAFEKMSLATSELMRAGPPKIAGSLYIARGATLRKIWMPVGLLVEDGFLKAMLTTDNFAKPENPARIVRADDAAHIFEAERKLARIYKHEKRLANGTAQNIILFDFLRAEIAAGRGTDGGEIVRKLNAEKPDWCQELTRAEIAKRGWRALPVELISLPFRQLKSLSGSRRIRRFPGAALRSVFNAAALIGAYFDLKNGQLKW